MSRRSRCHTCGHRPGPRSTAPMAKTQPHEEPRPKKATCGHSCHQPGIQCVEIPAATGALATREDSEHTSEPLGQQST